jgi:hypothetical protein
MGLEEGTMSLLDDLARIRMASYGEDYDNLPFEGQLMEKQAILQVLYKLEQEGFLDRKETIVITKEG